MSDLLVVIQARFNSTRLPGKVLKKIGSLSMLEHVRRRAQKLGPVVVALPPPDLPEDDVLSRFWLVACEHPEAQTFVRLTADCPMLDVGLSAGWIDLYRARGVDFLGTAPEWDGLDTEVFSRVALEMAHVHDQTEREHVTRWMRHAVRSEIIPYVPNQFDAGSNALRWSVDDADGLEFVRSVFYVCDPCREGVPHHTNSPGSISGSDRRPIWDLHQLQHGGLQECAAYELLMSRTQRVPYVSA